MTKYKPKEVLWKPTMQESELEGKEIVCFDDTIHIDEKNDVPVFISKGTITCQRHGHTIANVTAIVNTLKNKQNVFLPVQKCLTCNPPRFFVSDIILEEYERKNGLLYFRKFDDLEVYFQNSQSWENSDTESILYKLGYNVSEKEGLSDHQRHAVLLQILYSKQLSKAKMIHHIESLVRRHNSDKRYGLAVSKWKRDISFLANLKDSDEVYYGRLYR